MEESLREKIALFCDVDKDAVVPMVTASILYEVPLLLEKAGVGDYVLKRLGLQQTKDPDWKIWQQLVTETSSEKPRVSVALVGKYVELHDAYLSVREALKHAALHNGVELDIKWVHSAELDVNNPGSCLDGVDGILVPGGFGSRGIEGKIAAAHYARENLIPYFGLCLGMQLMAVDFARHIYNDPQANSTEFNHATRNPVISLMLEQRNITDMGGTMRLGLYPCHLLPGSKAAAAYQEDLVEERHRHRFEFNNEYRKIFEENGMVFSGVSPDNMLVEIAELKDHPFMLGTQFHPEFLSRPNRPHPLFMAFMEAVCKQAGVTPTKLII